MAFNAFAKQLFSIKKDGIGLEILLLKIQYLVVKVCVVLPYYSQQLKKKEQGSLLFT